MSDIFQIAGIGLLEGKQRLETISLNAASASLPGYRRHVVVGRSFDTAMTAAGTTTALPSAIDLKPGAMMLTSRPLDVAIDADDLFFALTDGAQTWLTRAGSFHVNEDGVLVGEHGLRVIGTQGEVHLSGDDVNVEADGRITQQGMTVAALQLFRPNERASLIAASGSLIWAPNGIQPVEPGIGRVRSGTLEASNTDASSEMLDLMTLSRQFESLTRVLQNYDELLGGAIQKLGEV